MGRESFVFYRDWLDAIEDLEDGDKLAIILGLAKYALDGEDPQLPKHLQLAFKMVRPMIDRDIEKWEDMRTKRSEAGKKHKGNQYTRKKEQQEQMIQEENAERFGTNGTRGTNGTNGTVNVNVNVNDNVGVNTQNAHPHAHMYVENENDEPAVAEFKAYMRWCIDSGYWYVNPDNVQRLQDFEYARLREKYTKEQIVEATRDLEGRQDYKDAHRYASQHAALVAFLRKIKTT